MSTATIIQAQDKGLRQHIAESLGKIRSFAIGLYAAHGGWIVQGAAATEGRQQLLSLAAAAESHSPALSAELRNFASR